VPFHRRRNLHSSHRHASGAALVLVLTALALISFLALAILSVARFETRASRTASELTELRTLAALPEKVVINQLRMGTSNLGISESYATQPGALRRFGTGSTDSKTGLAALGTIFKLYSAPSMIARDRGGHLAEEGQTLQQWASRYSSQKSSMVVDLNEPVRVAPRLRRTGRTEAPQDYWPILNPNALGLVDGFYLETAQGQRTSDVQATGRAGDIRRLPMPAYWIYILRDGSQVPGIPVEGGVRVAGASRENPIIGRIAFWTDDDSCKLNVNTASEPAPWMPPVGNTPMDRGYAQSMPARHEHHRVPGHPAYTSLNPVFRHFKPNAESVSTTADPTTTPLKHEPLNPLSNSQRWADYIKDSLALLPRSVRTDVASAGSQGGTQPTRQQAQLKQQRLLASIDELLFDPKRERNGNLMQEHLEKVHFFLTTHNSAPETNLFNQPKISLWPLQISPTERNALDKKYALAATLDATGAGSAIYAFQRMPGGPFDGSSLATPDIDMSLPRNQLLFSYLEVSCLRDVPGFGGTMEKKYGEQSSRQLVTAMLDYLRWGVNPASPQGASSGLSPSYRHQIPHGSYPGAGSAVPMRVPHPLGEKEPPGVPGSVSGDYFKGFGRHPVITEAALVYSVTEAQPGPNNRPIDDGDSFADIPRALRAFLVLEHLNVAPGVPGLSSSLRYNCSWSVGGAAEIRAGSLSYPLVLSFPRTGDPIPGSSRTVPSIQQRLFFSPSNPMLGTSAWGGQHGAYVGLASQFLLSNYRLGWQIGPKRLLETFNPDDPIDDDLFFGVASAEIQLDPTQLTRSTPEEWRNATLVLPEITVTLTAYQGILGSELGSQDVPVQSTSLRFPATTTRVPRLWIADPQINPTINPNRRPLATRFNQLRHPNAGALGEGPGWMPIIRPGDIVRSIELTGGLNGDARIAAARTQIPPQSAAGAPLGVPWYEPAPSLVGGQGAPYFDPTVEQAHSLRDDAWMMQGQLPVMNTPANTAPSLPPPVLTYTIAGSLLPGVTPAPSSAHSLAQSQPGAFNADPLPGGVGPTNRLGDFDTGPGLIQDGPYIATLPLSNAATEQASLGWFTRGGLASKDEDGVSFAPQAQISSAISFGSFPSGVYGYGTGNGSGSGQANPAPRPWQTLLFCPNPLSRVKNGTTPMDQPEWSITDPTKRDHFGFSFPRDHLWLENFWMPTVEPNVRDHMLATEGKVNLNHQIIPFTWIHRSTALHGALAGVRITAIPTQATDINGPAYKEPVQGLDQDLRYAVDAEATIKGLNQRFNKEKVPGSDIYRSPSEICDVFLVPKKLEDHNNYGGAPAPPADSSSASTEPTAYNNTLEWWHGNTRDNQDAFEATGDNLREQPYAQLYPRLCTRSNIFTVHYRVQVIRAGSSNAGEFQEFSGEVLAEQRGSATIERYLPPAPSQPYPDYMQTGDQSALDDHYAYRVVSRHTFAP
jgi:hypothetical protein